MNGFEFLYLTATDENTTYYNFEGQEITKEEFDRICETKDKNSI